MCSTVQIYRSMDGAEVAVVAATWELNPKITFASLADEFKTSRSKALKNYASIVTHNIEAAIKDPDMVIRAVNTARENPYDFTRKKFFEWFRGIPGIRYFIHFDLSESKDSTGVSMVHRLITGAIVVDFMLRVEVPFGRNINFAALREDFIYEMTRRGFHVQMVTYDGFQSSETRQVLEEKGYITDYESADRDTDAYDTLIELISNTTEFDRRLDFYQYPVFNLEMEELKLVNGTRYDHPRKNKFGKPGSKDVADAVACASKKAIEYSLENPVTPPASVTIHRAPAKSSWNQNYGERSRF